MQKTGFGTLVVIFDLKKKKKKKRKKPSALCNIYYTNSLLLLSYFGFVFEFDWHLIGLLLTPLALEGWGPPGVYVCFNDHTCLHQHRDPQDPEQDPQLENRAPKELGGVLSQQPRTWATSRQDLGALFHELEKPVSLSAVQETPQW